jgi:nicotinamidase/pyrazinamidase
MELGFDAVVIEDATRAIDTNGSLEKAWTRMDAAGVTRMQLRDFV